MATLKSGSGENIALEFNPSVQGSVPSSAIGGLTSQQVVFGSASGGVAQDPVFWYDSTNDRLTLGLATSVAAAKWSIYSTGADGFEVFRVDSSFQSPALQYLRLRTTGGVAGLPQATDPLGIFSFQGWDGGSFGEGARIHAVAGAAWTTASHPTQLAFFATPAGSTVLTERMTINSSGHVGFGTTAPLYNFVVQGKAGEDGLGQFRSVSGRNPTVEFYGGTTRAAYLQGVASGRGLFIQSPVLGDATTDHVGFFGSTGIARPSSYTPTAVTSGRVVPTTQSTVVAAVVSTAQYVALVNAFNQLLGLNRTILKDMAQFGLLST